MKKSNFRNYVFLILLICLASVQVFAQQGKSFKWSMALQNAKTSKNVPFSAPIQSATGEEYLLLIQPGAKSFIYVIAESPGDEITVLYAGQMKSGENWMSEKLVLTEPKGSESLFVIASLEEQKVLAQRISAFNDNGGTSQKRALMTEIFRIRSDASKFKESPEKPVLMGGASRNMVLTKLKNNEGSDQKNEGVEFSGVGTYVKTISIEH